MALGGFDELVSAGANALGFPDPFGSSGGSLQGSSMELVQVEGDPSQRVAVILKGRALPYSPVSWERTLRTKVRYYAGNPVATQQVLGTEESNTTFAGTWKDRFILGSVVVDGSTTEIDSAEKAVALFYKLQSAAKLIRVQWLSEVRTGLLVRVTPNYQRAQDIGWELEFEWQSRDDQVAPRNIAETGKSGDLVSFLDRVEDIAALVPLAADILASNVASIVSTINRVRDIVGDLVQVLRIAETVVNLPATVLGSIRSNLESLEREVADLMRRITGPRSSALDQASAQRLKGDTSDPRFSQRGAAVRSSADTQELTFEVWRRSLALSVSNLLYESQTQVAAIERRSQPETTRMITVREREDLYSISRRFYGAPDFANFLAFANRLNSVVVPPGTQLRIPPRPAGGSLAIQPVHSPQISCNARCSC